MPAKFVADKDTDSLVCASVDLCYCIICRTLTNPKWSHSYIISWLKQSRNKLSGQQRLSMHFWGCPLYRTFLTGMFMTWHTILLFVINYN